MIILSEVLFITPNFNCTVNNEPTGTLLLATLLESAGISAQILPLGKFRMHGESFSQFIGSAEEEILSIHPKILSFYTRCDSYHIDLILAQYVKDHLPDTVVVFGGHQSDLCAYDTLNEFDCMDYICRGEGETTIVPFFSSLLRGEPDLSVPGLAYKEKGAIICNERPKMIDDFSPYPPINYRLALNAGDTVNSAGISVEVGRGCPFSCTYCSTKLFWNRHYRLKSPESIVDEMQSLHDEFGLDTFVFEHDMFTMNRAKVVAICEKIKQLPFPAKWGCSARLDCLDKDLIDTMYDAGLRSLYIGIETGSPRMQKLINKNLKLSSAAEIVNYANQKDIGVMVSMIYGFPEETGEDLSQSLSLWLELLPNKKTSFQWHLLAFFPGTELELKYRSQLTVANRFSNQTGDFGVEECIDMINDHPSIFPQYREYKTALRENTDLLTVFLYVFKQYYPIFEEIYRQHFYNDLYGMYLAWKEYMNDCTGKNSLGELRTSCVQMSEQFIRQFNKFSNEALVSEITRYVIAESNKILTVNAEIYSFLIADLTQCRKLSEFRYGMSVVNRFKDEAGKIVSSIQSIIS